MKNNLALLLSLAVACSPMHGSLDETDTLFPHHYRTDGYSSEETRETSGLYDAGKRGVQLSAWLLPKVGLTTLLISAGVIIGWRLNRRLRNLEKIVLRTEAKVDMVQETLDREFPLVHEQLRGLSADQQAALVALRKLQTVSQTIDGKVSDIQRQQALQALLLGKNTDAILTLDNSLKELPNKEFIKETVQRATEHSKPVTLVQKIAQIRERYA